MGRLRQLLEARTRGVMAVPFPILGSGHYSTVYALSPSLALKFAFHDGCYFRYVQGIIRELKGNPYVPRIFAYYDCGDYDAYVIERLERPLNEQWYDVGRLTEIADTGNLDRCLNSEELAIMTWLHRQKLCNDFHEDNIMFRGNQPVIIDPAS